MEEGWECVEGCPVLELGRQSGERKSAGKYYGERNSGKNTAMWSQAEKLRDNSYAGETGTAARFFMQFGGEDNLIEPVEAELAEVSARVLQGDCLERLKELPDNSIDSCVTDPPAAISFMGKSWDGNRGGRAQWVAWLSEVMAEVLRVVKPGGHALVWALPRTSHWTALALEDAGWEIRDRISHIFGSGFPKSANISKHIDRMAGVEREVVGVNPNAQGRTRNKTGGNYGNDHESDRASVDVLTAPATEEAKKWEGWGSALKPATEDWWLCRKPLSEKNLASNVLKHSTGALNIEASRVDGKRWPSNLLLSHVPGPNGCARVGSRRVKSQNPAYADATKGQPGYHGRGSGRIAGQGIGHADSDGTEEVAAWECVESCPVKALDEQSGVLKSGTRKPGGQPTSNPIYGNRAISGVNHFDANAGGASRFFQQFHDPGFLYTSKASRAERNRGLEGMPERKSEHIKSKPLRQCNVCGTKAKAPGPNPRWPNCEHSDWAWVDIQDNGHKGGMTVNHHPTVKPLALMRYLLKLVTPPNGTTLDPFAGSGTTGVAALTEGFNAVLIEAEPEYVEIAERRCAHALLPEAEQAKAPKPAKARNTYGFKTTDVLRRCPEHNESIPSGSTTYKCGCAKVWYKVEPEPWEDKRTGPEGDDLTYGEVVEKFGTALAKTEEQFNEKLF